jgi:hypothetical protein
MFAFLFDHFPATVRAVESLHDVTRPKRASLASFSASIARLRRIAATRAVDDGVMAIRDARAIS